MIQETTQEPKIYRMGLLSTHIPDAFNMDNFKERFVNALHESWRKFFVEIEVKEVHSKETYTTFWKKRVVPKETIYHYTALFDVTKFNETQYSIFNAYCIGFMNGAFSKLIFGR